MSEDNFYEKYYPDMLLNLYKANLEIENECLKKAIDKFLDREATEEDYKKFSMVKHIGVYDSYLLAFCGVPIGTVERTILGNVLTVSFTPIK